MNSEKISYEHLELVMKYLEKHCKGNPIEIGLTSDHKVTLESKNLLGEYVKITIFRDDSSYSPRITKEDKLTL